MTLNIGRVTLPEITPVSRTGRGMVVSGSLIREELASVFGQQLRGLEEAANEPYYDETIVPVTWDVDPTFDGFYRVGSVQWDQSADNGQDYDDYVTWSLDLTRVAGNPVIESGLVGGIRENQHGVDYDDVNAPGWHGYPAVDTALGYRPTQQGVAVIGTTSDRTAEGGPVRIFTPNASTLSWLAAFSVEPDEHYIGACNIRDEDGNIMLGRTGRPATIDNGLLRVAVTVPVTNTLRITVESWGGAAWETPHSFDMISGTGGRNAYTQGIIRNRPEAAAISMPVQPAGLLTVSLRRGDRMARFFWEAIEADTVELRHTADAASADSGLTGGQVRTSADGDGNKWVLATPETFSGATVRAGITVTSRTSLDFAVGISPSGTGIDAPQELVYQYMSAQSERQRVVQL